MPLITFPEATTNNRVLAERAGPIFIASRLSAENTLAHGPLEEDALYVQSAGYETI